MTAGGRNAENRDEQPRASEVFDPEVVDAIASETDVDVDRLVALIDDLQTVATPRRTAADLVYEYRKAFAHDPLVERRSDAYYLAVPDHVWPELGAALDCSDTERRALAAVHRRQFQAILDDREGSRDRDEDTAALVLARLEARR